jgi:hypothetical protein
VQRETEIISRKVNDSCNPVDFQQKRKVKGLAGEVGGMKNLLQLVTLLAE